MVGRINAPHAIPAPEGLIIRNRSFKNQSPLPRIHIFKGIERIGYRQFASCIYFQVIRAGKLFISACHLYQDVITLSDRLYFFYLPVRAKVIEHRRIGIMIRVASATCQRQGHQPRSTVQYFFFPFLHREYLAGYTTDLTTKIFSGNDIAVFLFFQAGRSSWQRLQFVLYLSADRDQILIGSKAAGIGKRQIELIRLFGMGKPDAKLSFFTGFQVCEGRSLLLSVRPRDTQFIQVCIGVPVFKIDDQFVGWR